MSELLQKFTNSLRLIIATLGGSVLLAACSAPGPGTCAPASGQAVISVKAHIISRSSISVPADTSVTGLTHVLADVRRRTYFLDSAAATPALRHATNQAQHLTAELAPATYSLASTTPPRPHPTKRPTKRVAAPKPAWQLRLTLRGIGRRGQLAFLPQAAARRQATDSTITYAHGTAFRVEYINSPAGVRQNYHLARRPGGPAGPVQVRLTLATSLRVRAEGSTALSFANAAGPVLRYAGLRAWDANGRALPARLDLRAGGHELALVVEDNQAVYPVTIDPLASTPSTVIADPEATTNDQFSASISGAGDVNGDGYGDVIIGSVPAASNAQGKAYLYLGSSTGLGSTPVTTLTDPAKSSNDYFSSVASAGDVNGDGYGDVLIAAVGYPLANYRGQAYFYLGSSTGLSNTPTTTIPDPGNANYDFFGLSMAGAGDVNGDGYADVLIGAGGSAAGGKSYLYLGSSTGLNAAPTTTLPDPASTNDDYFGYSVAGAGDVNGDGYADVLVGAPLTATGGKSYVYLGKSGSAGLNTTPTTSFNDPAGNSSDQFGTSVAGAGDANGDGYADLLIGAPGSAAGGKSYLYLGSASPGSSPTATFPDPATTSGDQFGASVAGAGDVNGDGYADLLIGAPNTATGGKSYVYMGRSSAAAMSAAPTTTLADPAATSGDYFGLVVTGAGDVNGDGYADALISSYGYANKQGIAYVYMGSPGTLLASASTTFSGATSNSKFGISVAGAGDVNGDGYADVLIGASGATTGGKVYLYLGSGTGLNATATTTLSDPANTTNDYFGYSVAGAGDVNGDGYADVLIGAYGSSGSQGKGYLYMGRPTGLNTTPITLSEPGGASNNYFGYSVAGAGDVNGDGYADALIGAPTAAASGKSYFYLGSSTGLSTTPTTLNAATGQFGYCVAGVGDLNGDAFADVLIGAPAATGGGKSCLYLGTSAGLSAAPIILSNPAATTGDLFGSSVAGAGDVDGDGDADLLIGAPGSTAGAGKCYLYLGTSNGLNPTPTVLANPGATSTFGRAATSAGDVNGDGYSDVLIGVSSSGSPNTQGPSYLYLGSSTGLGTTVALSLTDPAAVATDLFGYGVAGAGDVNGDGYGDVLIGASGTSGSAGKSYLYLGNAGGARPGRLRLYNTDLTTPLTQANRSNSQFGIGLVARSAVGRVRVRLVWETMANSQSFSHNSPITNSTAYSGRGAWTNVPIDGVELKSLVNKAGAATRVRARLEYATSSPLASTAPANGTGGAGSLPRYSSWTYLTAQQQGQSSSSATPLPVVLTAFTASPQGADGLLSWQTASELDNRYFEVQTSPDGQVWQVLGQQPATGLRRYSWLDQNIARYGSSAVYYRLRQVDLDGSAHFSPVRMLTSATTSAALPLQAFPNPLPDGAMLQLAAQAATTGPATLTVCDALGRVWFTQQVVLAAGSNTITLAAASQWPAGVYAVRLVQGKQQQVVRLVRP